MNSTCHVPDQLNMSSGATSEDKANDDQVCSAAEMALPIQDFMLFACLLLTCKGHSGIYA